MAPPGDTPAVVCVTPVPGAGPPWVPSLAVAPGDPALTAAPGDTPSLACSALAGLAGFSFWTAVFGVTGLPPPDLMSSLLSGPSRPAPRKASSLPPLPYTL